MAKHKLPKGFIAKLECITVPGGPIDYIVASKELNGKIKWALFSVGENDELTQVSTADSPTKFDKTIWKNHGKYQEET